jgi:hypothetical protein
MTSGALSKGRKLEGDLGGKDVTLIPVEAVVMTIFNRPCPSSRDAI